MGSAVSSRHSRGRILAGGDNQGISIRGTQHGRGGVGGRNLPIKWKSESRNRKVDAYFTRMLLDSLMNVPGALAVKMAHGFFRFL